MSSSASSGAGNKKGDDNRVVGGGGLFGRISSKYAWIPYVVLGVVALGGLVVLATWLKKK